MEEVKIMEKMGKVIIANFGGYGLVDRSQYDDLAASIAATLEYYGIEVKIVTSIKEIDADSSTAVVFLSWGEIATAKKLRRDNPHIKKVILFTGIQRNAENEGVLIVHKNPKDGIKNLVSTILS